MRPLNGAVIFFQTILSFVLSRKIQRFNLIYSHRFLLRFDLIGFSCKIFFQ